jgi:hypothetical protein
MRIITLTPITKRRANLLVSDILRLNIWQAIAPELVSMANNPNGLPWADPVQ